MGKTRSELREKIMVILYQIDIYHERKVMCGTDRRTHRRTWWDHRTGFPSDQDLLFGDCIYVKSWGSGIRGEPEKRKRTRTAEFPQCELCELFPKGKEKSAHHRQFL